MLENIPIEAKAKIGSKKENDNHRLKKIKTRIFKKIFRYNTNKLENSLSSIEVKTDQDVEN